ncbi:MAG TPA: Arm DNA-binding domain-containing protein, partial [Xanthobacteraceae bacterium]|nr:Arm DNA-binding domain-containing protein [Xanthobacteraceae bacterium]
MRKFTDIAIRNLKPGPVRQEIADPGARGLYLIVQPSGHKGFAVRYRYAGKPCKLTLKSGISLAAARKEAADALYEVEKGRDPSEVKRVAKGAQRDTFRAIAEAYMRQQGSKLRTAKWIEQTLTRLVYGALGDRPIADIRRSEIVRLLDKIEE